MGPRPISWLGLGLLLCAPLGCGERTVWLPFPPDDQAGAILFFGVLGDELISMAADGARHAGVAFPRSFLGGSGASVVAMSLSEDLAELDIHAGEISNTPGGQTPRARHVYQADPFADAPSWSEINDAPASVSGFRLPERVSCTRWAHQRIEFDDLAITLGGVSLPGGEALLLTRAAIVRIGPDGRELERIPGPPTTASEIASSAAGGIWVAGAHELGRVTLSPLALEIVDSSTIGLTRDSAFSFDEAKVLAVGPGAPSEVYALTELGNVVRYFPPPVTVLGSLPRAGANIGKGGAVVRVPGELVVTAADTGYLYRFDASGVSTFAPPSLVTGMSSSRAEGDTVLVSASNTGNLFRFDGQHIDDLFMRGSDSTFRLLPWRDTTLAATELSGLREYRKDLDCVDLDADYSEVVTVVPLGDGLLLDGNDVSGQPLRSLYHPQ